MLPRLTQGLEFQGQALLLRSERQRLLASNIANADTPGYVARDMNFSQALREATSQLPVPGQATSLSVPGQARSLSVPGQMAATRSGHLQPVAGARSESRLAYATAAQTNLDSNTVDMDRERASFADNTVKYEATLRFINSSVRTTLDAMKSHNQG